MNELLPEGYTKPLVLPSKFLFILNNQSYKIFCFIIEPVERRLKKSRSVVHYSQRAKMKKH